MTRSRFTLLASALLTTACGQLLEASPDGFSFKPPLTNLCTAGTGNEGGSAGAANSAGRAGQAGSISAAGGSAGASAGSGGQGGSGGRAGSGGGAGIAGSAGFSGSGQAGSGNAGTSSGGAGESGAAGDSSGSAGSGGATAGAGGSSGSSTSPYTTITSTEFTPFQETPLTGVVGDLAVVSTGPSGFQVFARDATTLLISTASFAKTSWDGSLWTVLPLGKVDSNPAAAFDGFGNVLHVFARQGQPIVNFFQPTEEAAWEKRPVNDPSAVQVTSPPAAIRRMNDKRPLVFVVSAQGALLMGTADNDKLTTWQTLGTGLAPESAPAVVRDEDGGVDVLVRMGNDTLQRCRIEPGQNACSWSAWQGVTLDTSPAVASWAPGRLDVVVRDTTSGELRYRALREDKTLAPAWTPLPAVASVGAPAVVALSLGKLRVLVHDGDGKVFMASLKLE